MVIRIPIAALPPVRARRRPANRGGRRRRAATTATHCADLLAAHRVHAGPRPCCRPGTPTNVTEDSPGGAGTLDVGALFDAELAPLPERPLAPTTGPVTPPSPPGAAHPPGPATAAELLHRSAG